MKVDFAKCDYGQEEIQAVNRVMHSDWLASGPETEAFEREFADYIGTRYAVCVNSGTMANLLALASLDLPKGSKVLSAACGFPATVSPILHLGLEPVLVDYSTNMLNANMVQVKEKILNNEIKAIILAHSLGNPIDFDMLSIRSLCKSEGIKIIEDCCESVGSRLFDKPLGRESDLATYSFYPAHQITALGSGGMITTNDTELWIRLKSRRDWGKVWYWDDHLGHAKTSFKQNDFLNYDKPYYQHYTYQSLGWNAKLPDANAAFGREQLKRLDKFSEERHENYKYFTEKLEDFGEFFIPVYVHHAARPSWFGFPLILKKGDRDELSSFLTDSGIGHRPFFAGNITRHKPFENYHKSFPAADNIMKNVLFFGCWQGMGKQNMDYIIERIKLWTDSQSVSSPTVEKKS